MKLQKFYIANKHGEGLHYIQGSLYWKKPDTIETLENFTSFDTAEDALAFVFARNIPGHLYFRKITYTIS